MIDHTYYPSCLYCIHRRKDGNWLENCALYNVMLPCGQAHAICKEYVAQKDTQISDKEYQWLSEKLSIAGVLYTWVPNWSREVTPIFSLTEGIFVSEEAEKTHQFTLKGLKKENLI